MKRFTKFSLLLTATLTLLPQIGNAYDFGGDKPRILAHRGGRYEQEENTLEAFKVTYKAGCHGFETDIHFSSDKELVIMHDHKLDRTTTGTGKIEECTAQYIRSLKTRKGHKVPFASELADFFSGCSSLYVEWEMKTNKESYPDGIIGEYCDKVYAEIMPKKPADAVYVFSSFDERPIIYMKNKYPGIEVMLITSQPCSHETVDRCVSLGIHRCACTLDKSSREAVRYAHANDVKINLWPGYIPEDSHLAALLGADYLGTDCPVATMKYIKEHKSDISCKGPAPRAKKLICMDLDGTLTQHKTPISDEAKAALDALSKKYNLLIVGGGGVNRIHKQLKDYPVAILGNYGLEEAKIVNGKWTIVREEKVKIDTAFFSKACSELRKKYGFNEYYGDPVEFQKSGMVTFGLLGTRASSEKKLSFDPDRKKRRAIYDDVCKVFGDYSVFIGGSTSFDIAPKKYNKYDAIMRYAAENGYKKEEIVFIGDDLGLGGNDSHARLGGLDCIRVDNFEWFPELIKPLLK